MLQLYVDADSCPVKDEIYRVAMRYALSTHVVANESLRVPDGELFRAVLVEDRFDAADDWIADQVQADDIVVTGDILLAARCLEIGARVIGPRGRLFEETSIGDALAAREAQQFMREMGVTSGGPPPLKERDRSRFAQQLDALVQLVRRQA